MNHTSRLSKIENKMGFNNLFPSFWIWLKPHYYDTPDDPKELAKEIENAVNKFRLENGKISGFEKIGFIRAKIVRSPRRLLSLK